MLMLEGKRTVTSCPVEASTSQHPEGHFLKGVECETVFDDRLLRGFIKEDSHDMKKVTFTVA